MHTLLTSAVVLADSVDLDRDSVTPGVLGFLMVAAIGAALYFLMRNMSGKLGTLRSAEEADRAAAEADADDSEDARTDAARAGVAASSDADTPEDDSSDGPARKA
ncbi:hypothetical protein [Nocardiopsis sp. NRRL B-16309]|uniref:hypothetical protein n=1 Tax=Nocardiopsis sp. NRRL B-16309 TaxID=1519494 RepID=UPI0006C1DFAD|nr:hypothetical protein [Nocardiopsis sp. NRRL B-16309]KOX18306.1 hypothetical protein ADL05_07610 [Nocardiopsis sp. NRRL B-16309]